MAYYNNFRKEVKQMNKWTLKACRVNVQATAKEMAETIGVTEDTIYNWESGKYSPRAKQLVKILAYFNSKGLSITLNELKILPR
jgi:DNA-binding XRE family transcriptional regulator